MSVVDTINQDNLGTAVGPEFDTLYRWLLNHIQNLECPDADCRFHFQMKRTHTLRVVGEITTLGRRMQLPARAQYIARVIALLHDVGRFEQYKTYRTYTDAVSVDHGALSVRIVRDAGILHQLDDRTQDMICGAIHYHNKRTLPLDLSDETLFFARLIRDADKLDIYRVILKYGAKEKHRDFPLSNPLTADVSDRIYTVLMQGRAVNIVDIRNDTDMALSRLGWVFDLNFPPAFRQLVKRKHIEMIAAAMPDTPKVARIIAKVRQHLESAV